MKKIAFLVYDYSRVGGLYQVVASVSDALCNDYEVYILSLFQEKEVPHFINPRIKFVSFGNKEKRLRELRKSLKKPLSNYINKHKIDMVFLEGDYPGFVGSSLRFTTKAEIIFHEHGSLMSQWNRKDIVLIRFISSFLTHKTIVLTQRNKEAYKKKFFQKDKNIFVIPNWVEDLPINANKDYDITSKKIIYAGRLGKEKGILLLLEAWKSLEKKYNDWTLDIYGSGEEKTNIKEYITNNNLSHSVVMKGWVDQVAEIFNQYAFFVLPSEREGFPLVLIDAQQRGIPVISFDILTGPKEIINDDEDGIIVKNRDALSLANAMQNLIENPELRVSMSKNAVKNVERFSKKSILNIWKKILQ